MDNKPPFRLFELPGNQQMAGWVDASAEDPVLHLVMEQKGIRAHTQMNFNNPQAPAQSRQKGLLHILHAMTDEMAQDIAGKLAASVDEQPILASLQAARALLGGSEKPFARIHGPAGQEVLLVLDAMEDKKKPLLRVIAAQGQSFVEFDDKDMARRALADETLSWLSHKASQKIGIHKPSPSRPRMG